MMAQVDELNEVRAKIAEEMAIQNKSPEEQREVNRDVKKALDIVRETERKITAKKQKSINKIKAAVLEKAPELAAETISMSDEEFIIFANMYMNSHNDSIASEIALQGVLLAQEEHEIASEAERKLDAMPISERAGFYISAIKDAVKEYGREYLDSPLDHTLDLAGGTAYFAADVFVPGGIDNALDFYNGDISLSEAMAYQAAGADIFLGGVVKKAGAKVGRALSTASKGLTKRVVAKIAKGSKAEITKVSYRGGEYIKLPRGAGTERHHIPADSVTEVLRNKGMAIQMERQDHLRTSSWGNSEKAREYRNELRNQIKSGNIRQAVVKEIWDVKKATGTKYSHAIKEMLEYGKKEGLIPPKKIIGE